MTMRYDRVQLKATRTDAGYIKDTPVLTRTGVFEYRNPDGTTRREYRPPTSVFAADSLAAFAGIPITDGHPGKVTSANARLNVLGTVMSPGRQDGDDVLGDVIIYDPTPIEAGRKELSVGYEVRLDETPGTTPSGERYDAIQTNIKPNHLALVQRGRAGNARLNLDAADEVANQEHRMEQVQVRLDGLTYKADPEVAKRLDTLDSDRATAVDALAKAEARADAAEAKIKEAEAGAAQLKEDAFAAAKARIALEAKAAEAGVTFKADTKDRELREGIIKAVRGDSIDLTGKSDAYVEAAYDLADGEVKHRQDAVATARVQTTQHTDAEDKDLSAADARVHYIHNMRA